MCACVRVCVCVCVDAQDDMNLSNLHMLEPIFSIDVATYYKCLTSVYNTIDIYMKS